MMQFGHHNKSLKFIPGLTLSQHPPEQRKDLFLKKLKMIPIAKSLHPTEFAGYTIRERFAKMGWEQLLNFNCGKVYRRIVVQWMASLTRNGDELTGIVDGKSYTITPVIIRELLNVDTRADLQYVQFTEAEFKTTTDGNKTRWVEACKTVFGLNYEAKEGLKGYPYSQLTPIVKILWKIGVWTFHPRDLEDIDCVWAREIYLLHALFTGDYLYSFAHLMIDDIWDMYEDKNRQTIPHGYYISEILDRLGAVPEHEYVEIVDPQYHLISRASLLDLNFSETPTEYIIDDRVTEQRVTFPKKAINGPVSNAQVDMMKLLTNLQSVTMKQSSQSQERHEEMISMFSQLQKKMERQALEAERRDKDRERRAEERERQAEIRAHAIIWDIERLRYYYEQEQEQLRIARNQVNGDEGTDEFHFPQMTRISFHPPRVGSRYYDPTRSNEIPQTFQSLYDDIYGQRCYVTSQVTSSDQATHITAAQDPERPKRMASAPYWTSNYV